MHTVCVTPFDIVRILILMVIWTSDLPPLVIQRYIPWFLFPRWNDCNLEGVDNSKEYHKVPEAYHIH